MFTYRGIALDSWAFVSSDCHIATEVSDDQVEFEFGHRDGTLHLVVDAEEALTKLADEIATARAIIANPAEPPPISPAQNT